jgi:hypothetical protein
MTELTKYEVAITLEEVTDPSFYGGHGHAHADDSLIACFPSSVTDVSDLEYEILSAGEWKQVTDDELKFNAMLNEAELIDSLLRKAYQELEDDDELVEWQKLLDQTNGDLDDQDDIMEPQHLYGFVHVWRVD